MNALLASARALAGLAVGVVTGIAAVALHQHWWGLALAAVAASLAALALRPAATRLLMCAGLAAVVLRAALTRPEGDFLVLDDAAGWALLAGSLALLVWAFVSVVLAGSRRPAPAADRAESLPST